MRLVDLDADRATEVISLAIETATAPILDQVRQLDEAIETKEGELRTLKDLRRQAQRVLVALDPTSTPGRKPKAKANGSGQSAAAKEAIAKASRARHARENAAKRERLEAWLRENAPVFPEGFRYRDASKPLGFGDSLARRLFAELADAGVLRLDHVDEAHKSKFYKLVSNGETTT
jgi:hypothetical protein